MRKKTASESLLSFYSKMLKNEEASVIRIRPISYQIKYLDKTGSELAIIQVYCGTTDFSDYSRIESLVREVFEYTSSIINVKTK
jgi:hypothetical protein